MAEEGERTPKWEGDRTTTSWLLFVIHHLCSDGGFIWVRGIQNILKRATETQYPIENCVSQIESLLYLVPVYLLVLIVTSQVWQQTDDRNERVR